MHKFVVGIKNKQIFLSNASAVVVSHQVVEAVRTAEERRFRFGFEKACCRR